MKPSPQQQQSPCPTPPRVVATILLVLSQPATAPVPNRLNIPHHPANTPHKNNMVTHTQPSPQGCNPPPTMPTLNPSTTRPPNRLPPPLPTTSRQGQLTILSTQCFRNELCETCMCPSWNIVPSSYECCHCPVLNYHFMLMYLLILIISTK
jgi:hypothetical protein